MRDHERVCQLREILGGGGGGEREETVECSTTNSDNTTETLDLDALFKGLGNGDQQLQHAGSIHFHDDRDHWHFCPFCQLPFIDYDLLTDHVEDCHAEAIVEVRNILII